MKIVYEGGPYDSQADDVEDHVEQVAIPYVVHTTPDPHWLNWADAKIAVYSRQSDSVFRFVGEMPEGRIVTYPLRKEQP